jgi:hypothetical protein
VFFGKGLRLAAGLLIAALGLFVLPSAAWATGPVITTNPISSAVFAPSSATFTAAATGTPTPTVQWQVSTDGGASFNDIAGATSTTLSIIGFPGNDGDRYRAVFTNVDGTATTTAATLTVFFAPGVTTNPVSQSVAANTSVSFTAAASGNSTPGVQWQQSTDGGATFTNIAGATSTTLSFTAAAGDNGNQYRAVFTNIVGSATTTAATLTVTAGPVITTNPVNSAVFTPASGTFTAAATGSPTPTVQWQVSTDGGATFNDIAGATSTTLSIIGFPGEDGYRYRAVFTNSSGSATTTAATLTVFFAPGVTTNPVNQSVAANTSVSFTAAASGNTPPAVQWQQSTDGGATFANIAGATSTTLSFTAAGGDNGNQYHAVFTNIVGSATTAAATLTVTAAPVVTTNPTDQTLNAGQTATFTAAATGIPTPTVQWQVSTDGGTTFNNVAGATSTTLSFTAAAGQNGDKYRAVFTNGSGSATTTAATLTVKSAPTVTANPVNQSAAATSTVSFTAAATGSPTPTVQWQQSTDGGATFTNVAGATSTTLTLNNITAGMNGNEYRAVFTNSAGAATTTAATLTVTGGPQITTNPTDAAVNAAQTATFTAVATGAPTPTVQWQVSTDGGATFNNVPGATSTTLAFTATAGQNGNKYRAVFTNASGVATTSAATLTVNSAPTVTTNPVNQSVSATSTATFTAAASGNPAPTVQWQQSTDGGATFTNIAGAISTTLSFTVLANQNGNQYRAVFTNSAGSSTTTAAALTVTSGSQITTNPTDQTVNAGQNATFTAAASGNPTPTVQWQVSIDGGVTFNNVAGAASNTLILTAVTAAMSGNKYRAVFTNGGGTATTAAATLTVNPVQSTSTSLSSSQNPSSAGQAVTFTAKVTSSSGTPTGNVTFNDGGVPIGTAVLSSGVATFTISSLTVGTHPITASYAGGPAFTASVSSALSQAVSTPADSIKLRQLQALVTPMVAQASGQAISGAVDSAISEGFSGGGAFATPSAGGVRFNFAADPEASVATAAPRAIDPFSNASGSIASTNRGLAAPSRVDDAFNALGYAGPVKAPPLRAPEARDWLGWAEIRGTTLDRWNTASTFGFPATTSSVLYGNQVNLLAGLTRRLTPNFLVGVLGGYETFDYRSDALTGRLKGDGWTAGAYAGWMVTQRIRADAAVAYSGIGYDGTAGTASGTFAGNRMLVSGGVTGTFTGNGFRIEPSARVYALWERENAYTDTLGTLQGARDFSTGRASAGVKVAYPFAWTSSISLAPYAGLYGDYYFNSDSAAVPAVVPGAIPTGLAFDGWSARAVGGFAATFDGGAQLAVGAERGGIGGNVGVWTYRARGSIPFSAR